ncbi:MAG: hypothetical protein ACP5NI_09130 [Acetobacteraceae bacterium]
MAEPVSPPESPAPAPAPVPAEPVAAALAPGEPEEIIECSSPPCLLGELGPDFPIEERKSLPQTNKSAYHLKEAVSIHDGNPPENRDS